jgi:sigma-54 specific flagellar transcriptional regulator A
VRGTAPSRGLEAIIGSSPSVNEVKSLIKAIARSTSTVLILGESGTGKELVARALHDLSDRRDAQFVPINCAAIPKELIESELFGHRKGAFTGALADRVGRFELAHGGTLFLDEIGDLALDMQVKLLRVLQERAIDPIGSSRPIPIDVRIIAATHRDIESEIASGHFRQDLFYRLNVLPIEMPPLRGRLEDVPALVDHFARKLAGPGSGPIRISEDLAHVLQCYDWPGNIRELANLIDRLSVLYPGSRLSLGMVPMSMLPRGMRPYAERLVSMRETMSEAEELTEAEGLPEVFQSPERQHGPESIFPEASIAPEATGSFRLRLEEGGPQAEHAPFIIPEGIKSVEEILMIVDNEPADPANPGVELPDDGLHLKDHLAEIEKGLIVQALNRSDGNISQTARLLRLQRTTLIEKINKYGLRSD